MNKPFTTIIIDDEQLARERLLVLLKNSTEKFQVIATAKNGNEAKLKIEELNPDVIFLDIEMPGLTGFQLLKNLKVLPLVVFCTAYDTYALKAFETHSIDYLVKPVRLERLNITVEKLLRFKNNQSQSSKDLLRIVKELSSNKEKKKMTSITVKKADKLYFIKLEDVVYFEANEKYVTIFTDHAHHLTDMSLIQLETKLPDYFLRVQKSILINISYVKEVQKYFNSRFVITLNNTHKTSITTGRSYNDTIKNWMGV